MRAKTLKPFTDRTSGRVRYVGDEFECDGARFDELRRLSLVEKAGDGAEHDGVNTGIEYMTMPQLDEYAASIGIDTTKIRKKGGKLEAIKAAENN